MFVLAFILSTLLINSVTCRLAPIDPDNPIYTEHDFNVERMFSSASHLTVEEQCKPIRSWILSRHGEKYPSEETLENVSYKLIPIVQNKLIEVYTNSENFERLNYRTQQCIDKIMKWKNVLAKGSHKDLNEFGKQSMVDLGKRLNKKLKSLMKNIKNNEIEAVSAEEDRCFVSGKKLLSTLYEGDYDDININRNLGKDDRRLKLVKPHYSKIQVQDPDDSNKKIFIEDLFFKKNAWNVTKKVKMLLFPESTKNYEELREIITDELVKIMYEACVHGKYYSNDDGTSGGSWCCVFTFEDYRFFEQLSDLGYHTRNGYYLDSNKKMGNPIVRDLLQFLEDPKDLKLKLFMGHTSNCMSILTRFDMFHDPEKFTAENMMDQVQRKWKSSFMTPFGCNIVFIVFDCGYKTLKVTFYINEVPVKMRSDDEYLCEKCSLNQFIKLLKSFELDEDPKEEEPTDADIEAKLRKKKNLKEKMKEKEEKKKRERIQMEELRLKRAMDDEIITFGKLLGKKPIHAESSSTPIS